MLFIFNLGPGSSGFIVNSLGFEWMLIIIAILGMLYSPLMFFLKNPPGKECGPDNINQ